MENFAPVRTDLALEVHEKNQADLKRAGKPVPHPYGEGVEVE